MICRLILLVLWMNASALAQAADPSTGVGPWNLKELQTEIPSVTWIEQRRPVRSLLYEGESFRGAPTRVFAFYATPVTVGDASEGQTFPGVVLIHGGGGTAFADWAYLWAKRGYAAIAMDLAGSRPPDPRFDLQTGAPDGHHKHDPKLRKRLPRGGPDQTHVEKFDSIGGRTSDDWPFHAVANVIRAHTLLRSFPEVDAERTAVTGISWGGYTTCLAASLDDRFCAAVPVYGCGFLHESDSIQRVNIDGLGDRRADWVKTYDPSSYLARCTVPILFVNGTNDVHYPLDSSMKSYDLVAGPKQMCVTVRMPHSHPDGWARPEIGLFIDSHCRGGVPLPIPSEPTIEAGRVVLTCQSSTELDRAALHFTTDAGVWSKRQWTSVPATIDGRTITATAPPEDAEAWFLTIADERNAVVSTTVQFPR